MSSISSSETSITTTHHLTERQHGAGDARRPRRTWLQTENQLRRRRPRRRHPLLPPGRGYTPTTAPHQANRREAPPPLPPPPQREGNEGLSLRHRGEQNYAGKLQSKGECRWIGPALASNLLVTTGKLIPLDEIAERARGPPHRLQSLQRAEARRRSCPPNLRNGATRILGSRVESRHKCATFNAIIFRDESEPAIRPGDRRRRRPSTDIPSRLAAG